MKIVFDTNVWLDVLVFDNPLAKSLLIALQAHEARLAMCNDTQQELLHQLRRIAEAPAFNTARQQCALIASLHWERNEDCIVGEWDSSPHFIKNAAAEDAQFKGEYPYTHINYHNISLINSTSTDNTINSIRLPKCKDKDDQMFITLASEAQASLLITHDKALLKCRRYALSGSGEYGLIHTPSKALQWLQALSA